jgi:hypothetical protein
VELLFYEHVKERVYFIMGRWRVCLNVRGKLKDAGENCRMKIYVICTYSRILLHWPNGQHIVCVGETVRVYKLWSKI